ncbi:MAG: hypothetical protein GTO22_07395 [Gemmatimonadales bacterium]|nr:hypothetical protein [Gemmatimonadales bacterium]
MVYGRVATDDGSPVPDAFVKVHALLPATCDRFIGDAPPNGTAFTDESGRYRVVAKSIHVSRMEHCLAVHVTAPGGTGLTESTVRGALVTFIYESLTPPVDSVRVDVTLTRGA